MYYGSICLIDGGIGLLVILFIIYLFVGLASMLGVMHTTIIKSWGRCEQHEERIFFKFNKHGHHRVTWENGMSFCKCELGFLN